MVISKKSTVSFHALVTGALLMTFSAVSIAGNAQIHLAALKKTPSSKITTAKSANTVSNYLVARPKTEGSNYVSVVLKALINDADISLERKKLQAKLEKATPGQKALYAIYLMRTEVQFGGFKSYFSKKASDLLPEAREGLQLIGATNYLKLLNDALRLFVDDEYMLETALDRQTHLASISRSEKFRVFEKADAGFESLENESLLTDYMNSYINKHPKEFFIHK